MEARESESETGIKGNKMYGRLHLAKLKPLKMYLKNPGLMARINTVVDKF